MGNSSISLETAYDVIAAKGVPDPRTAPSGFGDTLALTLGTQVMADFVCERSNWKWNRATGLAVYTNSWQQDYPLPVQPAGPIGWGEDGDLVDINNTVTPKPLWNLKWRRGLSRTSVSMWRPQNICWMYNKDMSLGVWPGPGVTFYPLVGINSPQGQNPIMSMLDANGNILIVTTEGTTADIELPIETSQYTGGTLTCTVVLTYSGPNQTIPAGSFLALNGLTANTALNGQTLEVQSSGANSVTLGYPATGTCPVQLNPAAETGTAGSGAPFAPTGAAEGTTIKDGTVVWTVVSPNSQGIRLDRLPTANGTTYQVLPYFQLQPPAFTELSQMLDPIPDSYSRFFFRGLEAQCFMASDNPADQKRGEKAWDVWLESRPESLKQEDREPNIYAMLPATGVVQRRWYNGRPYTADDPI